MIDFLRTLGGIGLTAGLPERETRRIAFLNILVFANLPANALFLLLFVAYLPATWPILIVGILHFACSGFALFWNYLHRYLVARVWLATMDVVFIIFQTALLGTGVRFHVFLIISIFLMFY